jgi:hypothetical protein
MKIARETFVRFRLLGGRFCIRCAIMFPPKRKPKRKPWGGNDRIIAGAFVCSDCRLLLRRKLLARRKPGTLRKW